MYQIESLGDDDDQIEYNSTDMDMDDAPSFQQRQLRNLAAIDEVESLCPLTDAKVVNLADEDTPQIYALCGRGSKSTFRVLRRGLDISEVAISELPGNPSAVWTLKLDSKCKII